MAKKELQQFIENYFSLLNLKNMDAATKAHYAKLVQKNDFPNKTVASWKDSMVDGDWQLPDIERLSEDELPEDSLKILFKDLLRTFAGMSGNTKNEDAKKFLETFYGAGKLFNIPPIQNTDKVAIKKLLKLINDDENWKTLAGINWSNADTLSDILDGSIETDSSKAREFIYNSIGTINENLADLDPSNRQHFTNQLTTESIDLSNIQKAVRTNIEPTQDDLKKLKKSLPDMFKTLFKKKKAFEAFKQYEPGEKIVSSKIDDALSNTDYTGKINEGNYVAPTYDDKKNIWQNLRDKIQKDFYKDILKKYTTVHRYNLTMQPTAGKIVEVFDEIGLKPTDGIEGILAKAKDVSNKLKGKEPFSSAKHFDWMIQRLDSYKNNGLGSAIKTGLHNRNQLERIAEQLIVDAVPAGKKEEAKAALEVLSVMQYGLFDSRTMNALGAAEFSMLGDKGNSFNKNEYTAALTKAFDRVIKFGVKGIGYTVTAVANGAFRRSSRGLANSKRLRELVKGDYEKQAFLDDKQRRDEADKNDRTAYEDQQEQIRNDLGVRDIDEARRNLTANETNEARLKIRRDNAKAVLAPLEQIEEDYNFIKEASKNRINLMREIEALQKELRKAPGTPANQLDVAELDTKWAPKREELNQKQQDLAELERKIKEINARYPGDSPYKVRDAYYNNSRALTQAKRDFQSAETAYTTQQSSNEELRGKIKEYDDAQVEIDTLNRLLQERQDRADNWEPEYKADYLELMAHWTFLQTGKTKNILNLSNRRWQKRMDSKKRDTDPRTRKDQMFYDYLEQYKRQFN